MRTMGLIPVAALVVVGVAGLWWTESRRASPALRRLEGRWLRAEAIAEGDIVQVTIELRDVNYPGSTYRLWYDDGRDLLVGTYFQAVEQQTYDVSFARR